jgi:hypothetical protein
MKIKFEGKFPPDLKALEANLQKRIDNAGRHMGRAVAGHITEAVKSRLRGSGWIEIYRNAIFYRETPDGKQWAVAGLSQEDQLFEFPAKTSLAAFTATGDGQWPAKYNPWPIDMIPAANYRGTSIVVRSESEGTVETYRQARANNLPTLLADLAEQNISVTPDGKAVAENGVFADIAYLARRLELGYTGFPRVPHWGPAAGAARSSGDGWLRDPALLSLVEDAIKGVEPVEVPQMSKSEADALAKLREATWS